MGSERRPLHHQTLSSLKPYNLDEGLPPLEPSSFRPSVLELQILKLRDYRRGLSKGNSLRSRQSLLAGGLGTSGYEQCVNACSSFQTRLNTWA